MTLYVIYWLIAANAIAFILMVIDKRYAEAGRRRIAEDTLLGWAFFGGALGCFAASRLVRHKTRKQPFAAKMLFYLIAEITLLTLWTLGILNAWLALIINFP